jgi:hypothetical protein
VSRRAYLLMDAATTVENVIHGSQSIAPANERQARALARLSSPNEQRDAWRSRAGVNKKVLPQLLAEGNARARHLASVSVFKVTSASSCDRHG